MKIPKHREYVMLDESPMTHKDYLTLDRKQIEFLHSEIMSGENVTGCVVAIERLKK